MLNCKAGDLAVVVRSQCGNEGKIVKCIAFADLGDEIESECGTSVLVITNTASEHATWHLESPTKWADGKYYKAAKDKGLRPLRDTGEQDETLQWAGLPNKETA